MSSDQNQPRPPAPEQPGPLRPDAALDLTGRVVIVTGASRGIGRSIARAFVGAGACAVLTSRDERALTEAAAGLPAERILVFPADAASPKAAQACVTAAADRFGAVSVLVNNAAETGHRGPLMEADLERFDETVRLNLRGPLAWTQAVWRAGMAEHGGSILNIASLGGLATAGPPLGVYNATKAGLLHLTRMLALELRPRVRVNALAPGLIRTEMTKMLWAGEREQLISARLPLGRIGEPADIANAAVFLASDLASWITGHTLVVDGGALSALGAM